jgi:hypothetical protein
MAATRCASRSKQLALQCLPMPRAIFRFLAILLLALAIPAQGMASVVAGQCMAFGHHQDGAVPQSHAHGPQDADGDEHAAHSHDDAASTQGDESSSNSHCGPCTACCASASIAGPVGHPILSSPSNTKYVFFQSLPPGVQPDGLDRPPLAL